MHPIFEMLTGGDRRSIGRANEVVSRVLKEPDLFDTLISGMLLNDPVLRMRCADVVERVTAIHPEYLLPYKRIFLDALRKIEQAEVRWHVAPILARLSLSDDELKSAVNVLIDFLKDRSSIVKTAAIQALYELTMRNQSLLPLVLGHIKDVVVTGTPAMQARSRKLLAKLSRLTTVVSRSNFPSSHSQSAA